MRRKIASGGPQEWGYNKTNKGVLRIGIPPHLILKGTAFHRTCINYIINIRRYQGSRIPNLFYTRFFRKKVVFVWTFCKLNKICFLWGGLKVWTRLSQMVYNVLTYDGQRSHIWYQKLLIMPPKKHQTCLQNRLKLLKIERFGRRNSALSIFGQGSHISSHILDKALTNHVQRSHIWWTSLSHMISKITIMSPKNIEFVFK